MIEYCESYFTFSPKMYLKKILRTRFQITSILAEKGNKNYLNFNCQLIYSAKP